jgi:hypothetical protein
MYSIATAVFLGLSITVFLSTVKKYLHEPGPAPSTERNEKERKRGKGLNQQLIKSKVNNIVTKDRIKTLGSVGTM